MGISRLIDGIVIRRMLSRDVATRVKLLHDPDVMRNIVDVAAVESSENLEYGNRARLKKGWGDHLDFLFEKHDSTVVGFGWLADIDWVARRCEFSIAIIPEYRMGLGQVCYLAMMRFVFTQLNLESIYCQVYETNRMMMTNDRLASGASVKAEGDVFVAGEWRTCYSWIESKTDFELAAVR